MDWLIIFLAPKIHLICFLIALILALLGALVHKDAKLNYFYDRLFSYVLLFNVGITCLWSFVFHAFFTRLTVWRSGWQPSPFEFEVAMAYLSYAILGILAFFEKFNFRMAVALGAGIYMAGCAIAHLYQLVNFHNLTSGNAGFVLYFDIFIPLILWLLAGRELLTRENFN